MKKEIRVKVVLTKAGDTWDSSKTYALLDYIAQADGVVYVSKKAGNTGHAVTDTEWWDKTIDLSGYITKVEQATTAANTATAGAGNVNATLTDNVITVTDRTGKSSSVKVGTAADVAVIKEKQAALEETVGKMPDGYYEGMRVGTADNLATKGDASEETFMTRTAGGTHQIEDGSANIKTIKGYSLVGNQLYILPTLQNKENIEYNRIDDWTLSVKNSADNETYSVVLTKFIIPNGHKFLINANSNNYNIKSGIRTYKGGDFPYASTLKELNKVFTGTGVDSFVQIWIGANVTATFSCQVIDLTQMFGAGNEPASADEMAQRLGYASFAAMPYIPYSTGEICNSNVVGVKTTDTEGKSYERKWTQTMEQYFLDGLKSAGSVRDEITPAKAVRRVQSVDLGTLIWGRSEEYNCWQAEMPMNYKFGSLNSAYVNCSKYLHLEQLEFVKGDDKTISGNSSSIIFIRDSSYSDASAFKTALNGVMLNYELATPEEYSYDEVNLTERVYNGGTESAIVAEGKKSTPLVADIAYPIDAYNTIMANKERIGELSSLDTKEKSNLVAAVNEVLKRQEEHSGATLVGFQRPNGDPLPDAQKTYGTKAEFNEVAKHLRMAVVKNGKARYMAPGRITMDEDGKEVAIDGSEGDILCATDRELHMMRATKELDGVEQNVIGMSLGACTWNGASSKKIPKFGMVPGYTVNAQIGDDIRIQAHSVYDKTVKGSYSKPADVFTVSAIDGGGMPNWSISGLASIQYAQKKNNDELTARPYMGLHTDMYGTWLAMMYAEMGTLNINTLNRMGVGNTNISCDASSFYDTGISGNSCMKTIPADGTEGYHRLMDKNLHVAGGELLSNLSCLNNSQYVFTGMLEPQRVMDAITRDALTDKVGDPATFFYFGEDGSMLTIEKSDTFDVTTGIGMAVATRYYQVRNVPGCDGLADGVMTGVVNCYMRMDCKDGVTRSDGVSMTGGKVIYKFSHPVYRGMSLPLDGMFRQLSYMYYLKYGHGKNKTMESVLYATDNIEDVKALQSFGTDAYSGDQDARLPVLDGLGVRGDKMPEKSGLLKRVDYSQSLFLGLEVGGGLNTYECSYQWSIRSYGGVATDGFVPEGKKQVCASAAGCSAGNGVPSPRSLDAYGGMANGDSSYAGAFAVLL